MFFSSSGGWTSINCFVSKRSHIRYCIRTWSIHIYLDGIFPAQGMSEMHSMQSSQRLELFTVLFCIPSVFSYGSRIHGSHTLRSDIQIWSYIYLYGHLASFACSLCQSAQKLDKIESESDPIETRLRYRGFFLSLTIISCINQEKKHTEPLFLVISFSSNQICFPVWCIWNGNPCVRKWTM